MVTRPDPLVLAVVLAAAAAVWLASAPALRVRERRGPRPTGARPDLLRRGRVWWSLSAGLGAAVFVPPVLAVPAFVLAGGACWVVAGRTEPAAVRRDRETAARELPHLVGLLGSALRAGLPPDRALRAACEALPGPAADRLQHTLARLSLGMDPETVWRELGDDLVLGRLGRSLVRAHRSGASVAGAVDRLAEELDRLRRGAAEDAARTVGVRAAVPLGLCLLPAFLLLGVVPTVAALLTTITR